jgi:hypothetical protein
MHRYSAHVESILQFLQAKESSVGFLKKNGGKCIDAALLLAEWFRVTFKPLQVRIINDIIAAMWGVLSERQLITFGVQCALWLRSSLHLLSSSECHKWFGIIRSINSSSSLRLLSSYQLLYDALCRLPTLLKWRALHLTFICCRHFEAVVMSAEIAGCAACGLSRLDSVRVTSFRRNTPTTERPCDYHAGASGAGALFHDAACQSAAQNR